MQKKITAMLVLCLMLCAMSAAAFAATVSFKAGEGSGTKAAVTDAGSAWTVPGYDGFTAPAGKKFLCWKVENGKLCYLPNEKADVAANMTLVAVWAKESSVMIEYLPGRGTGPRQLKECEIYNREGYERVDYPQDHDFVAPGNESFIGWLVEGDFIDPNDIEIGPDLGMLFSRAIAEVQAKRVSEETELIVYGPLKITALWTNDADKIPAGGNGGGGYTGGGDNGAAANMPSTGDNSLRIDFLFMMMAASLVALRLLAKKRIN